MKKNVLPTVASIAALVFLIVSAQYNYLLFHSIAEFFSVVVGCGIFMFAWTSRKYTDNDFFLFLGLAYLFVIFFDFMHSLSYRGMGVFPGYDANLPTQIWIATRYTQSICLLLSPLFLTRKLNTTLTCIAFVVVTAVFTNSIVTGVFPDCFVEGQGLTPFKKISEMIISVILVMAGLHFWRNRQRMTESTYRLILASIIMTIAAEISFIFYISVYGASNLLGHIFKIISFYLIYKAVIVHGIKEPYEALYAREQELQLALDEVKTLRGIVPICMHCKKIRDKDGYWEIVEKYVSDHSHAEFSHGICESCLQKYYRDDAG